MIVEALVIILVILIISNFAVGIFNKMVPPCNDSDYFQGSRNLPDDALVGLGSIPSHVGFDYVGAATVATGKPGVIGLTSYPSLQKNSIEGYINHMNINEEDPSDCESKSDDTVSTKAVAAIHDILQTNKKHCSGANKIVDTNSKSGSINRFDVTMEGIAARNPHKKSQPRDHRLLSHSSERDGYES